MKVLWLRFSGSHLELVSVYWTDVLFAIDVGIPSKMEFSVAKEYLGGSIWTVFAANIYHHL